MTSTPTGPLALTAKQLDTLHRNINPGRVKKRTQGTATLSYVEAYDIRATLIRVFGYGGFSIDVLESKLLDARGYTRDGKDMLAVAMQATVRLTIPQLGATYTETAVSGQSNSSFGDAADFAIKTAVSDALKRCAINLGTQFGLSLYNNGSTMDVVKVVLAPGQDAIIDDVNLTRAGGDEAQAAKARLQDRMKVHAPEPEPAPEAEPAAVEATASTITVSAPAARKPTRKRTTTKVPDSGIPNPPTSTADRHALARQALAQAQTAVGLDTPTTYEERELADIGTAQAAEYDAEQAR